MGSKANDPTSFRLNNDDKRLIKQLATKLDVSYIDVICISVREKAERHGIQSHRPLTMDLRIRL